MDEHELKSMIFYCCREKHYNCMLKACEDGVSRYRGDLHFNFLHAVALALCEQYEDALQEFETLRAESDYKLAIVIALMCTHRAMGSAEKDLFIKFDLQIRELRKSTSYTDLYNSAVLLFAFKKYEKAYEYIEKALAIEPTLPHLLTVKGWIQIYMIKSNLRSFKSSNTFELSLRDNKRNLDSSLGLAESYTYEKNYDEALSILNKAVVRFPAINLGLEQKMKFYFTIQNWEQCVEVMSRLKLLEEDNLEVARIHILMLICNEGKYKEAVKQIQNYIELLEMKEPKNGVLMVESAQIFSRACGRNGSILEKTHEMVEKALQIAPNNTTFMTEMGHQCYLQAKYKEAINLYKAVCKLDDSSIEALMGMTYCDFLENGLNDQIQHQIAFLVELQESNNSPMILFMQAKTAEKSDQALKYLNEVCEIQLNTIRNIPYSSDYLLKLDPDFLLCVSKELLFYVPQSPEFFAMNKHIQHSNEEIKTVESVLKILAKACPGLQEALFLLAKVQFLNGGANKAKNTLEPILNSMDTTYSQGYLLMAQIQVYLEQYDRAAQNLEMGLSHNFTIRDHPLYHYILGIIEKNRGNLDDAIKSFTTALHQTSKSIQSKGNFSDLNLSLADKASLYFKLIDAHTEANQVHEATKLIEAATQEFSGTSQEARIVILNADKAIQNKDVQRAIDMLNKVEQNEKYYLQAKTKLAKIFLEHRRDVKAYLRCYQEMVSSNPGPESYLLLGDAYIYILEITKALDAYQKALEYYQNDPYLCSKMGKALVKTHYYAKAVAYYQDAIKLTDSPDLKLELSGLFIKLKQYDKAEMLLTSEVESESQKKLDDIPSLRYRTKLLITLANIHEKVGKTSAALKTLKNAKENQQRLIKRLSMEEAEIPEEEMKSFKDVCLKLSELAVSMKDNEGAVMYYKDALSVVMNDHLILINLAKLYMTMGNLELCQQTCAMILKVDPDDEEASLMMAEIAFRKIDFDVASFHFTTLLSKQPTNWKALVKFIEVCKRTGELQEIPKYLQKAEKFSVKYKNPGYYYCTALYEWYTGNLNAALRNFNNARTDMEWGKKALCNMIEICLNPEDELLGDQFFDSDDTEYRDSRSMALKTADRLLREFKQKSSSSEEDNFKHRLLGGFLLLAIKEKPNIERALEEFTSLASQEMYRDEVGPILGMATAYTFLKQSQRAKNQLKRVVKNVWTFEDAEYLERCWLLLADYYIQSSKFELASDLLKRTLQHNKSCTKAYEFSGYIAEKEQVYKEAANYYELAWKCGNRANPSVGYKLAFCYMKCKKYAEAIDICQQVLRNHPDYPRIKKDILEKSLNNLRT